MKAIELRNQTYRELTAKLDESKEELFNLRFQMATNQLDNTARLRQVRREVARINTVMRQMQLEEWRRQQEGSA
ncbi:MAG: 50S ribosomal protein L29 [Acidimicrobiia bacterium]|nr:50S ribosomal protein L29 [Acidimicrobiia bacterium]